MPFCTSLRKLLTCCNPASTRTIYLFKIRPRRKEQASRTIGKFHRSRFVRIQNNVVKDIVLDIVIVGFAFFAATITSCVGVKSLDEGSQISVVTLLIYTHILFRNVNFITRNVENYALSFELLDLPASLTDIQIASINIDGHVVRQRRCVHHSARLDLDHWLAGIRLRRGGQFFDKPINVGCHILL